MTQKDLLRLRIAHLKEKLAPRINFAREKIKWVANILPGKSAVYMWLSCKNGSLKVLRIDSDEPLSLCMIARRDTDREDSTPSLHDQTKLKRYERY